MRIAIGVLMVLLFASAAHADEAATLACVAVAFEDRMTTELSPLLDELDAAATGGKAADMNDRLENFAAHRGAFGHMYVVIESCEKENGSKLSKESMSAALRHAVELDRTLARSCKGVSEACVQFERDLEKAVRGPLSVLYQ